jgi:hypothetical protein
MVLHDLTVHDAFSAFPKTKIQTGRNIRNVSNLNNAQSMGYKRKYELSQTVIHTCKRE